MGRGGACCGGDEAGDKVEYDPANGPIQNRSCTDVLCLLLLVIFCVLWAAVAAFAFANGNPYQLVYPSNSEGEICGRGDFSDKPNMLYYDLTRCLNISTPSLSSPSLSTPSLSAAMGGCATPQVCVKECPSFFWTFFDPVANLTSNMNPDDVTPELEEQIAQNMTNVTENLSYGKIERIKGYCRNLAGGEFENRSMEDLVKQRKCPSFLVPSKTFLGRCVPTFGLEADNNLTNMQVEMMKTLDGSNVESEKLKKGLEFIMKAIDAMGRFDRLMAELSSNWWKILLGFVFAMVISFIYIMLMKVCCKAMVWISIVLSVVTLVGATAFCWWQYFDLGEDEKTNLPPVVSSLSAYKFNRDTWLVAAIILSVFTLIFLLVLLFVIKRIQIAIELIEEASKAVGAMPSIFVFPVFPFLLEVAVIVWFLAVGIFLWTSGSKEYKVVAMTADATYCVKNVENGELYQNNEKCDPATFREGCPETSCTTDQCPLCVFHKYGPYDYYYTFQVYNLFGMFWLLWFMTGLGDMVIAGSVAAWYWTLDKSETMWNVGALPSLYRVVRYHLGTLAFGSLLLAIVSMLRVLLEWIEQKMAQYGADNPVVKCLACFCRCCLWCLEKCIRYINKNAYIMTAIYGYNFCAGAIKSFALIIANIARAAVLDQVTNLVLFMGKIFVVVTATAATFAMFSEEVNTELDIHMNYYNLIPMIFVAVGSYAIASVFFSVYGMAVDTIFLCFLMDIDQHDGTAENPYFMNEDLKRILEIEEEKKEGETKDEKEEKK